MLAGRANSHASSLPAPTLHAGYSAAQSKSHVLAGVQDAYWSDDENEDNECPLCLEEMDISDLGFKPCVCGYQICRFCWHHIKENLNGRCPACRREYKEETVEFKAVNPEEHKKLMQQKKQRERERKELEALGRKHLANVRVVQRNVVYVTGMGSRFAKEDLIPHLRSPDYFGQYGKITKIVVVKRSNPGSPTPVIGLYITYHRREDAARCIALVDGAPAPGEKPTDLLRASYGTTKYCMSFLRGVTCSDHACMNLHEWGDEKDCFTKEDLTTLKHSIKDSETRTKTSGKPESEGALPRGASWASQKPALVATSSATNTRQSKRATGSTRGSRSEARSSTTTAATGGRPAREEKRTAATKASSQASNSRPATPVMTPAISAAVTAPVETKSARRKEVQPDPAPASPETTNSAPSQPSSVPKSPVAVQPPAPPAPPAKAESPQQVTIAPSPAPAPPSVPPGLPAVPPGLPAVPPGLPAIPPGLSAPPGLPAPKLQAEPITPQISSSSSYTMSTQAQALLDDIKARREQPPVVSTQAPFPDLERTLQALTLGAGGESGHFAFSLDPALKGEDDEDELNDTGLPDFATEADLPYNGNFMSAFPGLQPSTAAVDSMSNVPPGLGSNIRTSSRPIYDALGARPMQDRAAASTSYSGSFNPFDSTDSLGHIPSQASSALGDEDRKTSRFGFARGRQGSAAPSVASSSPLQSYATAEIHSTPFYSSHANSPALTSWSARPEYPRTTSRTASPFAAAQPSTQPPFAPQPLRHMYDQEVSEEQLRNMIRGNQVQTQARSMSTDQRSNPSPFGGGPGSHAPQHNFHDPAIMSASFGPPGLNLPEQNFANHGMMNARNYPNPAMAFGPPPGLPFRQGSVPSPGPVMSSHHPGHPDPAHDSTSTSPFPSSPAPLSTTEFPALLVVSAEGSGEQSLVQSPTSTPIDLHNATIEGAPVMTAAQEKAERKAAKKAAAAERAAERAKIAQERAASRAAEKARLVAEKAEAKEKEAAAKALKEQEEKERLEREKTERAKERAVRAEKAERERAAKEKAENAKQEQASNTKRANPTSTDKGKKDVVLPVKIAAVPSVAQVDSVATPMLSKMPKKHKPVTRPIRIPDKVIIQDVTSSAPSATTSDNPPLPSTKPAVPVERETVTAYSSDGAYSDRATLEELLDQIDMVQPKMNLLDHPFFDISKINPTSKMPLEYGPLVHALSALSVGGGSFANNMPSGSIDNAVSSFQQLLETLTQTISDLLRLLPRTTWDDSSSFDGVLRDMLKGDDFLDDGGEDGHAREDEVAALTLALERRARWMEVQLSKLEELHRDINTAAVRAILSFNDRGWDKHDFMPRNGNTLTRFDNLAVCTDENGTVRAMSADELEQKLIVANEAAVFAETELKESMEKMQGLRALDDF